MTFNPRKFFILIFLLFFPTLANASSLGVVELTGQKLRPFLGKPIARLSVQAFQQGQWRTIPFQVDEKVSDPYSGTRRWALDHAFSRRTNLPQGNGTLDADEVILFMKKDMER